MSATFCRHDTDHAGDIAPCQLAGSHVGVMSARINCDVSAHNGGAGNKITTTTTEGQRKYNNQIDTEEDKGL
jgi:hypothetical protein